MTPLTIGGIMIAVMVIGLAAGVHIGVALLATSLFGVWWITGDLGMACTMISSGSFYVVFDYVLAVVPLFALMGYWASAGGATRDLFDASKVWLGGIRGGLGIATVASNAVFAAVTGVSAASAAVFAKTALPEMIRAGYDKKFSLGTITGSSVLGMLIPPSILFIVYGLFSAQGIGRLFIAGIIPGIILSSVYSVGIFLMGLKSPGLVGWTGISQKLKLSDRLRVLVRTWTVLVLIVVVLGGIWGGVFSPTEAAAVGVVGALLLGLVRRRLTISSLWDSLLETGLLSASFFLVFIGAQMFGRMLAMSGLVQTLATTALALPIPPIAIIVAILVIFLLLGCILDSISIMVITLPIMIPVVTALGFDLIWFGVVAVITIEMGLLTPPFGLVVFVTKSAIGDLAEVQDIFRGGVPFLVMMAMVLAVIVAFPMLSTWLPGLMR
jgi:tripartite ATP-independent transporter DctM subunit